MQDAEERERHRAAKSVREEAIRQLQVYVESARASGASPRSRWQLRTGSEFHTPCWFWMSVVEAKRTAEQSGGRWIRTTVGRDHLQLDRAGGAGLPEP